MKALKPISILVVLISFVACDDDWVMDLEPPYGGYIWRVTNGGNTGSIIKIDPVTGEYVEGGASTPFPGAEYDYPPTYNGYGYNYDAAAGDGRVWVGGRVQGMEGYSAIWEVGGDLFPSYSSGLTYDGEYLWAPDYEWDGDDLYIDFIRINPDTYEEVYTFTYDIDERSLLGLAWDGTYLWALIAPGWGGGTEGDKEFVQFDPETGDVLHMVPCTIEVPLGLTWDGEALWVNDAKSDRMYRVSPEDGAILGYHEMSPPGRLPPPAPYGLAFEFPSE